MARSNERRCGPQGAGASLTFGRRGPTSSHSPPRQLPAIQRHRPTCWRPMPGGFRLLGSAPSPWTRLGPGQCGGAKESESGYDEQVVAVVPSHDLVIVRLGLTREGGTWDHARDLRLSSRHFRLAREEIESGAGQSRASRRQKHSRDRDQAAGSSSVASSFSGLFTRVEIGHIAMGSAGNGTSRSCGSGSRPSQRS